MTVYKSLTFFKMIFDNKEEKKALLFNIEATQPDILSKRHGGGKYGEVIFRRIVERGLPVVCYYDSNRWLNPDIRKIIDDNGIELYDVQKIKLQNLIDSLQINKIFSAQYTIELASLHNVNIVGTIHGLRGLETPWDKDMIYYRPFKNLIRYYYYKFFSEKRFEREYALLNAIFSNKRCQVITVSYHSATSIKSYLPKYRDNYVPVFYSPSTSVDVKIVREYNDKYFLIVSANRSYKNALRAIRAFDRLIDSGYLDGYNVRITGASSWNAYRYKPKHPDRFEFHGFVEEEELEQLYHDAYCLVYPSLNEGFGYPPLEAMHYGIPVISSSFSSIPEVCGDAVLYFNPLSVEEIMSRILLIINEERHFLYSEKARKRFEEITQKQNKDLDMLINFIYDIEK